MLHARTRVIALGCLALGAVACGEDGTGNPITGPSPTNGTMSATLDGQGWTAVQIQVTRSGNIIAVAGSSTDLLSVGFAFVDAGTGSYAIGAATPTTNASVIGNLTDTWKADGTQGGGVIAVTTLTATRIAGTFNFTADQFNGSLTPATRQVTNGQFDVTF